MVTTLFNIMAFPRPSRKCEERFQPRTKHTRLCDYCFSHKNDILRLYARDTTPYSIRDEYHKKLSEWKTILDSRLKKVKSS